MTNTRFSDVPRIGDPRADRALETLQTLLTQYDDEVQASLALKSDVGHLHDDRYYTEDEVDALLEGMFNPSGGMLSIKEGSAAQNIGTTPVVVTGYDTAGPARRVTQSVANGTIIPDDAGSYDVAFTTSFDASVNIDVECYVYVNDVEDDSEWHRSIGTANDKGSASLVGRVTLSADDVIDIRVKANADTKEWTPNALNFRVTRAW